VGAQTFIDESTIESSGTAMLPPDLALRFRTLCEALLAGARPRPVQCMSRGNDGIDIFFSAPTPAGAVKTGSFWSGSRPQEFRTDAPEHSVAALVYLSDLLVQYAITQANARGRILELMRRETRSWPDQWPD
jgi:hypothetical protein